MHPDLTSDLERPVSRSLTKDLMQIMWLHIARDSMRLPVNTYTTENPSNYHLYWAPLANKLDYATPGNYNLATQLSFDLPHNAVHLYHLAQANPSLGCRRYWDNMAQRAYFESVAVLSEYKEYQLLKQGDTSFTEVLTDHIIPEDMYDDELIQWMIDDRGYEFKLRAARYAADVLMLQGASFNETVNIIAKTFNVPREHADKETRKYLPWTGLGAVYTFGYRKLENEGIDAISEAIANNKNEVINSWSDFSGKN